MLLNKYRSMPSKYAHAWCSGAYLCLHGAMQAVLQQYTMDEGELASKVVKLGTQGYKVHLAEPVIPTRSSTNMASDAERMLAEDSVGDILDLCGVCASEAVCAMGL